MAKISAYICDLCKSYEKSLKHSIKIGPKRAKTNECFLAEICVKCFEELWQKLENREHNFPKINHLTPTGAVGTFVPSANKTPVIGASEKENKCDHYAKSFVYERNVLVCKDCGHEAKAP